MAIKRKAMADRGEDTAYYDRKIQQKIDQIKGLAEQLKEKGRQYKKIGK